MANSLIDKILIDQNKVLTGVALDYKNADLIGEKLFPRVLTDEEIVRIPEFAADHMKIYKSERALRADSNMVTPGEISSQEFSLEERSIAFPLDYREASAGRNWLNLESRYARVASESLLLEREWRIADMVQDEDNYPDANVNTLTGDDQWSDVDSHPVSQIDNAILQVMKSIGSKPNVMVLGLDAWIKLKNHNEIRSAIFGADSSGVANSGLIMPDMIAKLFGLSGVYVGASSYLASDSDTTFTNIWNDNAVIAYVPQDSEELRDYYAPAFGYSLQHESTPPSITTYYKDGNKKVEIIEATLLTRHVMLLPQAGYLIKDTNA